MCHVPETEQEMEALVQRAERRGYTADQITELLAKILKRRASERRANLSTLTPGQWDAILATTRDERKALADEARQRTSSCSCKAGV